MLSQPWWLYQGDLFLRWPVNEWKQPGCLTKMMKSAASCFFTSSRMQSTSDFSTLCFITAWAVTDCLTIWLAGRLTDEPTDQIIDFSFSLRGLPVILQVNLTGSPSSTSMVCGSSSTLGACVLESSTVSAGGISMGCMTTENRTGRVSRKVISIPKNCT